MWPSVAGQPRRSRGRRTIQSTGYEAQISRRGSLEQDVLGMLRSGMPYVGVDCGAMGKETFDQVGLAGGGLRHGERPITRSESETGSEQSRMGNA